MFHTIAEKPVVRKSSPQNGLTKKIGPKQHERSKQPNCKPEKKWYQNPTYKHNLGPTICGKDIEMRNSKPKPCRVPKQWENQSEPEGPERPQKTPSPVSWGLNSLCRKNEGHCSETPTKQMQLRESVQTFKIRLGKAFKTNNRTPIRVARPGSEPL